MNVRAVDFFCGVGGLTRGFLDAGIRVLCGTDNDASAKITYETNNSLDGENVPFVEADLRTLEPSALKRCLKDSEGGALVFAACPPCRWFSKINTDKNGIEHEADLILRLIPFVEYFKPEVLLVENVPGIQSERYGRLLPKFMGALEELDYESEYRLIDAKKYGVPQNRLRAIMLASKKSWIGFPEPTRGPGTYRTVLQAIGDPTRFPPIAAGECHPVVPNHQAANLSAMNLRRIRATPKDGGGRLAWQEHGSLSLLCYQDHKGHTDVYGRMRWDAPAPALTTRFNSLSNGRFGHPEQDRAISLREGAALQTFADDYIFYGSQAQIARHVGNAVPVLLAKSFAEHIVCALRTCGGTMPSVSHRVRL